MTINYAQAYEQALQKRYSENGLLFTQKLWNSASNALLKFVGAKEVKVPKLLVTSGRKDRARRTITDIEANYSNDWETYKLENERYWSTLVDPLDIDETNYVVSIANITKVFNDTEKVPEMDKYMVSKLYARKTALDSENKQIKKLTLTEENFLATFDALMEQMDEAGVPAKDRTLFVTPVVARIIKNIKQFGRTVNVHGQGGTIDRSIGRLDDVTIEPSIPSDRMKTAYNFTNGAKADGSAKQIQMFLIHIPCMAAPQKYSFAGIDQPSAATSGNYLYYEQSYDDVLLFAAKHEGLAFVVEP
ncbi:capsid protein [Aerococcaceae bacterium NML191219]|nr:capsid protein [Aerococcaceae bacterium NML191219]